MRLDDNSKIRLINQLIEVRRELTWAAQNEANRLSILLLKYQNKGSLAKSELFEISNSNDERDQLAIYALVNGIRGEIKRYVCEASIYGSLARARTHIRQIERCLEDIEQLKKSMVTIV